MRLYGGYSCCACSFSFCFVSGLGFWPLDWNVWEGADWIREVGFYCVWRAVFLFCSVGLVRLERVDWLVGMWDEVFIDSIVLCIVLRSSLGRFHEMLIDWIAFVIRFITIGVTFNKMMYSSEAINYSVRNTYKN